MLSVTMRHDGRIRIQSLKSIPVQTAKNSGPMLSYSRELVCVQAPCSGNIRWKWVRYTSTLSPDGRIYRTGMKHVRPTCWANVDGGTRYQQACIERKPSHVYSVHVDILILTLSTTDHSDPQWYHISTLTNTYHFTTS